MRLRVAVLALLASACGSDRPTVPTGTVDFSIRAVAQTGGPQSSIRLARDPSSGAFLVLKLDGDILRFTLGATPSRVYSADDTGVALPQGMAFGPEGTLYLVGNEILGLDQVGIIRRGVPAGGDRRQWTTLARTVPYPRSATTFDHMFSGIAVSPDGRDVYVSSGSRTDHGEIQTSGGRFPGLREVPLTALLLRLPANAQDLVLPNEPAALAPFVFARGLRNSFDPAFNAAGDLLAGDNSGDRDDSDELNWLREGRHYGFPWRLGTSDTPQQFRGYNPQSDRLLNPLFNAVQSGFFYDDPTYPARPQTPLVDPIPNLGPDANRFRDPATGAIRTASSLGTFTTHRSPLGLAFDVAGSLSGRYRGGAFILGWTRGDPAGDSIAGPIGDASEDLLYLDLTKSGDAYQLHAYSVVCGFQNPIDSVIAGGKVYVLEFGGTGQVWEITTPEREPASARTCTRVPR
jgi:glucose/arabinose dehydrogenase